MPLVSGGAAGVVMPGNATLDPTVLVDALVPTIDAVRDLYRSLGVTQWRVFTVRRTWSGARRGEGSSTDVETEILPVPRITDMRGRELDPTGMHEAKSIKLLEVSLTYTETDLLGAAAGDITAKVDWLYKIVDARGQGLAARFFEVGKTPPVADREKNLGWTVVLERADGVD